MKFIIPFLFYFCICSVTAQSNYQSELSEELLLNTPRVNLELMGRIWGFLKYHHPAITAGEYDWDHELIRILPDYVKAKTNQERDKILINWINSLGQIRQCNSCESVNSKAFLKPDITWFTQYGISKPLQDKLHYIFANRSQGEQFYVGLQKGAGNPVFRNENSYPKMAYPDVGYRLLALYRHWNIIHYFFPYTYLMDKEWQSVLPDSINSFIMAKTELEYELAVLRIVEAVQDSHAGFYGDKVFEERGQYYPSVVTRFIEGKLVVTDYYTKYKNNKEFQSLSSGLEIGDVIITIDGESVDKLVEARLPFYPASNYSGKLRRIAPDLLRSKSDNITITYKRDKEEKTQKIQLFSRQKLGIFDYFKKEKQGRSYTSLKPDIGYVTLKKIQKNDVEIIKDKFRKTKGIIIDIRNYPATFVPFLLGSFFVKNVTPFAKFSRVNINTPGEFSITEPNYLSMERVGYQGKLVVLVNEYSISQSEYTAMAFRAGQNTTIIGSQTAGADGNVSRLSLPGGIRTAISGIGVYYPDGGETQRVGIVPDIEILPTIAGVRAGRDEVLEKAIEVIEAEL